MISTMSGGKLRAGSAAAVVVGPADFAAGGAGRAPFFRVFADTAGAINALLIFTEPHVGHVTSPRRVCVSNAPLFWNHASKPWPF
jgi:hypothetical protein